MTSKTSSQKIVNEEKINRLLEETKEPDSKRVLEIIEKAKLKKGLSLEEATCLVNLNNTELIQELFGVAVRIKHEIYGERLVFFAPFYISDFCVNDCDYCNFHARNKGLVRKKLTSQTIREQTQILIGQGHKRLLVEAGEEPTNNTIDYVVEAIKAIYSVKTEKGNIRRVNVNIAATTTENYRKLKEAQIGTYQLFQETYHQPTYKKLHRGPKADFERQMTAHLRAFEAGIDDLGIGALFGLYDWRFEVLALISHAAFLERTLGIGPHTISVPRTRPAPTVTYQPEYPVSDEDFLKLIAILRVSVPYTGMILSTRERPELRHKALNIGISQISAGSKTTVGGYDNHETEGQFTISDERPLNEVVKAILPERLMPSFCTACYRLGRTGDDFMKIAKAGRIHNFCRPNALFSFTEYLESFVKNSDPELYSQGSDLIDHYLNKIPDNKIKILAERKIQEVKAGKKDVYI